MADILGTAVGVVSLGLQVSQGIVTYYSAYRGQAEEIDGIAQRTQALHNTLKLLQVSLGNLQYNHTAAVGLVAATIASCADNIKTLDTTLQKCRLDVPTSKREKICFLGKKAVFPFRQATLQRLENVVGKLQANVDMALMTLQLEVSCKLSEQTSNVITTSAATIIGIDFIVKKLTDLDASFTRIGGVLPALENTFTVMDRHLQQYDTKSKLFNDYMIRELSKVKTTAQDLPASIEKATSRALNSNQKQLPLMANDAPSKALVSSDGNLAFKRSIRKGARNYCSCQSQASREGKYSYWYFSTRHFQFLRSTVDSGCRHPDCPSKSYSEKKNTWELTYSHRSRLFSAILRARLCVITTAGSLLSISPHLIFHKTVSTRSPVFRLMNDIQDKAYGDEFIGLALDMDDITIQIRKLLANGQASLSDVNRRGESILHMACLIAEDLDLTNTDVFESYKRFLKFLAANTPSPMINETNTNGERPLEILFGSKVLGYYHPEIPNLCLELIDSMGLELSDSWLENQYFLSGCQWWDNYSRHLAMSLSSFRDVPEILGFHCGGLSSTILQRSEDRMLQILANFPESAYERNAIGQTPLHLSSDWPIGISHLLPIGGRSLVDKKDCMGYLPVAYALYSGSLPAVQLLLDADSPLYSFQGANSFQSDIPHDTRTDITPRAYNVLLDAFYSSSRTIIQCMIYTLVDRRKRLCELAFQNLPEQKRNILPVSENQVLDLYASSTCTLLKTFGVDIPLALYVPKECETAYDLLFVYDIYLRDYAIPRVEIAEMLYDAGFREIEECNCLESKTTLLMIMWTDHDTDPERIKDKFKLLSWLLQKGADLHRVKRVLQGDRWISWTPATHFISASVTIQDLWIIANQDPRLPSYSIFSLPEVEKVMSKVLTALATDPCVCACSGSGCVALTIMLKEIVLEIDENDFCASHKISEEEFSLESSYWILRACIKFITRLVCMDDITMNLLAPEFIRFATFTTLELTHTCCVYHPYREREPHHFTPFDVGDGEEIREEEDAQIDELEKLVAEFEAQYIERKQHLLDFFDGYWRPRMREYTEVNTKPYTEDELEEIHELGVRI